MPQTIITRPIGPTYALSVTTAQTVPIGVVQTQGEPMNYAEFLGLPNSGTSGVCVTIAPLPNPPANPSTPPLVFPNATSAASAPPSFMLPPNDSRVVPVPANGFSVSAIASSGTTAVFITPVSVM